MQNFIFLLQASVNTLYLSILSLLFGLILALIFLALEANKLKIISWLATTLVTIIRGLPELLVILFVYNGIPWLLSLLPNYFGRLNVSPFSCGVIALSLLYGAYASQSLRAGLKAVSIGQWEAGLALGLSKHRVFWRIILPQMWRHALPGLGNQWLILLKDTALVSLISINELMMQANNIRIRTHEPFTWYMYAALIYLLISLASQYIIQYLAKRTTHFERSSS